MSLPRRREKPRRKRPELFPYLAARKKPAAGKQRTGRIKARREGKRRSSRTEDPMYLEWLRHQPCGLAALRDTHPLGALIGRCWGRIDPEHERDKVGMGQTASDCRAWSCCRGHHRERHGEGTKTFWAALDLGQQREVIAERIDTSWARYQAQVARAA